MAGSDELTARAVNLFQSELARLVDATPRSKALFERACKTMPLGVASSFQAADPYPIYLASGDGAEVVDVDGRRYIDYHNGFGSMAVGHAHPAVAAAIERAAHSGHPLRRDDRAHRAACRGAVPSVPDGTGPVRELGYRGDDGRDPSRGRTGRDPISRSRAPTTATTTRSCLGHAEPHAARGRGGPGDRAPASRGIPAEMGKWTLAVPYNDLAGGGAALHRAGLGDRLSHHRARDDEHRDRVAAPGLSRGTAELCNRHGIVLIFDEVKCGATIAAGGATELFGVQPDLSCFAKSVFGGTPAGAFGGRADLMDEIGKGIAQQGTFNGNPLVVAAGLAALTRC